MKGGRVLQFSESVNEEARRAEKEFDSQGLSTRAVNRAEAWLLQDQLSRANVRGHEFDCDEPVERGGSDTAPSPLEYMLAGVAFCQEVMIARNAAVQELELEDARVRIAGYFDRRGGHVEGVENRGFEEVRIDVSFETSESAETIIELMEVVDRQCYAVNTLRRAAVIRQTIRVNGEQIAGNVYDPSD